MILANALKKVEQLVLNIIHQIRSVTMAFFELQASDLWAQVPGVALSHTIEFCFSLSLAFEILVVLIAQFIIVGFD